MDYYSITTSEVEWRAAICLCGSLACRGSFLHFATQDDLQQVLLQKCPPATRVANLLRGCMTDTHISSADTETLKRHGMGEIALGRNSPNFMKRYAAEILKLLEFERRVLPMALLRSTDDTPSPYSFSSADMDARCVLEQRMQSLVCCYSMVSKFLSQQPEEMQFKKPLRMLTNQEVAVSVWKVMQSIPKLLQKHVVKAAAASNSSIEQATANIEILSGAITAIKLLLTGSPPTGMYALGEKLGELQAIIKTLHDLSTPTARLLLLSDVLSLWAHTTNFAVIEVCEV
jgi:[histone H3]-lysine4 N-trimethyltransferase ATXR3